MQDDPKVTVSWLPRKQHRIKIHILNSLFFKFINIVKKVFGYLM